ncbi:hypothetical protein CEXT_36241 [Caerostris extrusa]|uniref:Uncharacterized protein n=1 Tax=Caerostris extrusa TaxID=172846 RepID=A0AAV4MG98_CAEEX|nr:hypothetical protein CEXT_36241 [Caerostris extrusa]
MTLSLNSVHPYTNLVIPSFKFSHTVVDRDSNLGTVTVGRSNSYANTSHNDTRGGRRRRDKGESDGGGTERGSACRGRVAT